MPVTTNLPGLSTQGGGVPGAAGGAGQNPNLLGTGGTGGLFGSLFGNIPGVADPVASAGQAISGNRENLPNLANLTYGADTIANAAAPMGLESNLPGYEGMLQTATGNVSSELAGQLPQDVVNQITQGAAERGIQTGQGPNSPNTNAAFLQALGSTSLGQTQTGLSGLEGLIGATPQGAAFNPASMFVTPESEQSANQAVQNAMAAPDPTASGIFSSIMSLI